MILRNYISCEVLDHGFLIHGDKADVLLVFLTDDIIRIRTSFERSRTERSYALTVTAWDDDLDDLFEKERTRIQALSITPAEDEKKIVFETKHLSLVLHKSPFHFSLYDKNGSLLYSDLPERAFEKDQLGRKYHYSSIEPAYDHFYGFGEKSGSLDKKGKRLRMNPKDAIGGDPENADPLYKHIPFYIRMDERSGNALGFFYNNSYDAVFDMGQEISGYWHRYSYYQTDGGDIDLFLINGPDPYQVIDRYTMLTGRSILPSKQSLGFSLTTMYYCELENHCDQEILRVIDEFDRQDLPIDNFWMGSGYSSGEEDNLRYVFNWNRRRFPDPDQFLREMSDRGLVVVPNLKPGLLKRHPLLLELIDQKDTLILNPDNDDAYIGRWWGGPGRFFDFTGKPGREAWKRLLREQILDRGAEGIWNDNCEYDGIEDREARCAGNGFGGTMAELKIIQSNMMAYTGKEAWEAWRPEERPHIISRAGFAGIQRYAQVWDGDNLTDWRSLQCNVNTIIGMGVSGVPNTGEDVGGFAGPAPEGELMLRWIQSSLFSPRFCMNSANTDNTVTQPWMYEELIPNVRRAMWKRYEMLPYLYSQMALAHECGLPVMRPVCFEFPHDARTYHLCDGLFMFGDAVLVACVFEKGAKTRKIYLPEGCHWYDLADHMREYEGGQTIEIPVDLDSVPMFLRGGSIYYTTHDIRKIKKDVLTSLDLIISAEKDCSSVFYDDDGHSTEYQKGVYARTSIDVKADQRTILHFHREGAYQPTVKQMTVRLVSKEKGGLFVSLGQKKLDRYLIGHLWEQAEEGWYYNLSDRTIQVKFKIPDSADFELLISKEHFDLIGMGEEEA